jgi:hypothetical protein
MSTIYPAGIDTTTSLPLVIDGQTNISASVINSLRAAIIAIEAENGINPAGTFSTVRARLDFLTSQIGGGGGSFTPGGDLSGTSDLQRVIGLQGIPVSSAMPLIGQILQYDGAGWLATTPSTDLIFEITVFGPGLTLVGSIAYNPLFTASYSASPATATFQDNQGGPSMNVLTASPAAPYQFFYQTGSFTAQYSFDTYGSSVLFTLTSTAGGETAIATYMMIWAQPIFYGVSTIPGSFNSAFVNSLSNSNLALSRQNTFTATLGASQYLYYAYRSAYGAATFTVGGWVGGISLVATVAVTNENGFTENYYVYQSDFSDLGTITVNVF